MSAMSWARPAARLFFTSASRPITGIVLLRAHLEGLERRAERGKCMVNALGIAAVRAYQHIHVLRCPRVPMERYRVPTDQNEICAGVRQLEQEITKILGKLDHPPRPFTKRTGISARVYLGKDLPAAAQLSRVSRSTSDTASGPDNG